MNGKLLLWTVSTSAYRHKPRMWFLCHAVLFVSALTAPYSPLYRECTRGGFCNFMHLKPISRELRRELYGRRRKGYKHIHYLLYSGTLSVCLCSCFPAVHNHFSFTPTAVTGLGLDRERGDLALGTEVEEADVTTRGVVPETENVPGDSEPQSHD